MREYLNDAMRRLPRLLDQADWNSLYIDYEKPTVERLWIQDGENRIYLHRIKWCAPGEALWHPHPWPSAICVLKGRYEMGIGYSVTMDPPQACCTMEAIAPFTYEMTNINAWHYVRPMDEVLSVMVTGPKWGRQEIKSPNPMRALNFQEKLKLYQDFKKILK